MEVTITHCRYAPSWVSLQRVLRETTNDPGGIIKKVTREDNKCNYRAPGVYNLDFEQSNRTVLPIRLTVVAVGERLDDLPPLGMSNIELAS